MSHTHYVHGALVVVPAAGGFAECSSLMCVYRHSQQGFTVCRAVCCAPLCICCVCLPSTAELAELWEGPKGVEQRRARQLCLAAAGGELADVQVRHVATGSRPTALFWLAPLLGRTAAGRARACVQGTLTPGVGGLLQLPGRCQTPLGVPHHVAHADETMVPVCRSVVSVLCC